MKNICQQITAKQQSGKKQLAILIDPDKIADKEQFTLFIRKAEEAHPDYFFVGGSLITSGDLQKTILWIKGCSKTPVVIFPGDHSQIASEADAILLLSLISGRNPELLIGQHVNASFALDRSKLEIIPTGYLLIESGVVTTALYISGTSAIPRNKNEIAAATALAGVQLGMKLIYLDGGSGAKESVPAEMISKVRKHINVPLIVGGGIKTIEQAHTAWQAGADLIVIGTAFENDPELLSSFILR